MRPGSVDSELAARFTAATASRTSYGPGLTLDERYPALGSGEITLGGEGNRANGITLDTKSRVPRVGLITGCR